MTYYQGRMDGDSHPVGGTDYPRIFQELDQWFRDDAACRDYTFRFNRRRSRARGLLFHRLAEQAVTVGPGPYRAITGKSANPPVSRG